ncbi:PAN domain-containing protein [Aspergillus ruber CBS 135680]|uniref:Apple domain-containing protein n=1 Tax=Aspergillus ruber (strain CBS 135680) TaxID=1388766 RepID=A0A017SDA8_ASPRC|nr:uncharacterized protein EURHEDRAFT_378053 [Aspergillus ruber CBS 135680]EYE94594.1 hypothetical protein EURHEDRAFT_378053 [Aspergillus ruber CBS 135680]
MHLASTGGGGGSPINPANPPPGSGAPGGTPINPANPPPGSGAPGAPISPGNLPPAPGSGAPESPGGGAAGNCAVPRNQQNLSPQPTTQISCPNSDGSVWESYDGTWYYLQCCTAANAQALSVGLPQVYTHEDCLHQCSGVPNCQAATFDPSTDQCVLYDFGVFSQTAHSVQLYAFVTDPPVTQTPSLTSRLCSTSRPAANGQIYTFRMDCRKRHGTQVLSKDILSSLEECMELCSASPSCSSVDFDEKRGICYQSINDGPPALNAPTFASAHTVGCSGACEGCGDGCFKPAQQQPDNPDQCTNDNAVVTRGGMPFRVRCGLCNTSTLGDFQANIKNHDECMEVFVTEEANYDAANWVTGHGCVFKPGPISSIDPNTGCTAAFVPLWK